MQTKRTERLYDNALRAMGVTAADYRQFLLDYMARKFGWNAQRKSRIKCGRTAMTVYELQWLRGEGGRKWLRDMKRP